MNKRIHLPTEERMKKILAAALKVFSTKGFDATTNKEIAEEAEMASPGLIYHYFKDKFSLLRAIVEEHITTDSQAMQLEVMESGSIRDGLKLIVRKHINDMSNPAFVSFIRMLLGEAMRRKEFAAILSEIMVGRMFTMMTGFFQSHIDKGSIRAIDPEVATLRFAGSLISLLMMREVLKLPAVCAMNLDELEDQLVDDFLQGLLP